MGDAQLWQDGQEMGVPFKSTVAQQASIHLWEITAHTNRQIMSQVADMIVKFGLSSYLSGQAIYNVITDLGSILEAHS